MKKHMYKCPGCYTARGGATYSIKSVEVDDSELIDELSKDGWEWSFEEAYLRHKAPKRLNEIKEEVKQEKEQASKAQKKRKLSDLSGEEKLDILDALKKDPESGLELATRYNLHAKTISAIAKDVLH